MPITRTRSRRYVSTCPVADCEWPGDMHRHRTFVNERLRHHLKQTHDLEMVEDTLEGTHGMKVQKETELPEQTEGDRLGNYVGELIVFAKGWEHVTSGERVRTRYGDRPFIEANVFVYEPDTKTWGNPGLMRVYWQVVIARLVDAGDDDDLGGVLTQGTKRNPKEWDLAPPSAAQVKVLDKFDPSF